HLGPLPGWLGTPPRQGQLHCEWHVLPLSGTKQFGAARGDGLGVGRALECLARENVNVAVTILPAADQIDVDVVALARAGDGEARHPAILLRELKPRHVRAALRVVEAAREHEILVDELLPPQEVTDCTEHLADGGALLDVQVPRSAPWQWRALGPVPLDVVKDRLQRLAQGHGRCLVRPWRDETVPAVDDAHATPPSTAA